MNVIDQEDAITSSIEMRRQRTIFLITICLSETEFYSLVFNCDADCKLLSRLSLLLHKFIVSDCVICTNDSQVGGNQIIVRPLTYLHWERR